MKLDSENLLCFYPIWPKEAKSHFNVSTIPIIMDINWYGKIISKHPNTDSNFPQNAQINSLRSEPTIHQTSMR